MSPHRQATSHVATPVGGPLVTRTTLTFAAFAAIAIGLLVWRFATGLGNATAMSDGYPWGIWIAYDVVTGTAIACGGYAMAILVYIFNKGRYHPLVRPAVLTSALGYSLAALSVLFDVGRPWRGWRLAFPWLWNTNSVLLEVAVCIALYTFVLWIELAPAFLETAAQARSSTLRGIASALRGPLAKALPFILALGMLLPTMHQSSLGALMMVAGSKLHPLWHTPFLPLLFLITVVGMGYAAVVFEAAISALVLGRRPETPMLSSIARIIPYLVGAYVVIRLVDLGIAGRLGLIFTSGLLSAMFLLELALLVTPAVLLLGAVSHRRVLPIATQFGAAVMLIAGGALYRFDTFLVAFNPGAGWHYFPSVAEILVSIGIIALEVLGYILIVKRFPILTGASGTTRQIAKGAA